MNGKSKAKLNHLYLHCMMAAGFWALKSVRTLKQNIVGCPQP